VEDNNKVGTRSLLLEITLTFLSSTLKSRQSRTTYHKLLFPHYICQRIAMIDLAVFICNDLGCWVVVVSMVEDGVGS